MSIDYFDPQDLKIVAKIGSGAFASVFTANRKITRSIFAIKKFTGHTKEKDVENEIRLIEMVKPHPNIITFWGVTKFTGERYYSLVLEYANGGTLGGYLKKNKETFGWEKQLEFAEEITSAIYYLHDEEIIHGDLHPNNILIHHGTIKIADFGCARLEGSDYQTKTFGVIPYIDPNILNIQGIERDSYILTKKNDIYSLGVLFWQLTSRKSPFGFETENSPTLVLEILGGKREEPVPGTNSKFVELYQKCWQHEPDKRPNIHQVNSELNLINPENNNVSITFTPKESEENGKTENLYLSD